MVSLSVGKRTGRGCQTSGGCSSLRGAGIYNLQSPIKAGPHLPPQHHSDKEINKAKGDQGKGGEINSNFKQYLLQKRTCWRFALNILMCYGVVLCQQKQSASSRLFSTAERQAALRKQSNTNTGWSTQAHLFPGTATASVRNRNTQSTSQHCTIPAHNSCSANCSHQVRGQVKD